MAWVTSKVYLDNGGVCTLSLLPGWCEDVMVGNEAAILDNDFIDMESHVEENRTTKQKESISLLKQSNW